MQAKQFVLLELRICKCFIWKVHQQLQYNMQVIVTSDAICVYELQRTIVKHFIATVCNNASYIKDFMEFINNFKRIWNYCFTMFHICQTIWQQFSLRQVKLCIGQRNYKQHFTTQGKKQLLTDWLREWIHTRSLNSYFVFWKIVIQNQIKQISLQF